MIVRLFFWKPYNDAKLYGDFRGLIKALRDGDPMTNEPEVRELMADQLEAPISISTKTQARDGWPYAQEVHREMILGNVSKYRAMQVVCNRHPKLNPETLKTYCRSYENALRKCQRIIEENQ